MSCCLAWGEAPCGLRFGMLLKKGGAAKVVFGSPTVAPIIFKLCTVVPEARCLYVLIAWTCASRTEL